MKIQAINKLTALSLPLLAVNASTGTKVYGNNWIDVLDGINWIDVLLDENDSDTVIFRLVMEKDSWMGLSLGSTGMAPNTDMIQVDGANQVVYDKMSSGYQNPSSDSIDNLSATFTESGNGNLLFVEISRALDTGDSTDYVIPTTSSFALGWAIKTSSATLSQKHN